jgi:hypothetical protein
MSAGANKLWLAAFVLAFALLAADVTAQLLPGGPGSSLASGPGTNLSSVMYFEPPHDQQIAFRLSGAEMSPLPGVALYDVKKLKIEKFTPEGKLEAVVQAPECTYAQLDGVASSAGPLDLLLDDGKIHLQGEGFLFDRTEQTLTVSNQVRTVIKMGTWKMTTP